ncbi:Ulp1 protease family, C-terminal catalytic domain [Sesbania bispinosa]|nr:Ulp1 protease family, C-terminal catalytic domain [Sesbania bispinosa]
MTADRKLPMTHYEQPTGVEYNAMNTGSQQQRKRKIPNQLTENISRKYVDINVTTIDSMNTTKNIERPEAGDSLSSTEDGREKMEKQLNKYEDLRQVMNNMATLIVKYIPMNGSINDSNGDSSETYSEVSPLSKQNETENIISRMWNPSIKGKGTADYTGGSLEGKRIEKQETKKGATIPSWMSVVFKPPSCMLIDESDAKIAAYIFAADYVASLPGDEVLMKSQSMMGKRSTLKTLMPTSHVHHDVMNMLVCKLTEEEQLLDSISTAWFMPTMFAEYALKTYSTPESVMEQFKGPFMGKVEFVTKIFVPIQDKSIHWYLLVIDIDEQMLILLDSHPCDLRREWRRIQVRKVALFLQEMLMDQSFYDFSDTEKPDIVGFTLIEPNGIGQELHASNDSGVWVATWMMDYDWDDDYDKISEWTIRKITTASRMRLAIDLVRHDYNEMRDIIMKRANKHWNSYDKHRETIMKAIFG